MRYSISKNILYFFIYFIFLVPPSLAAILLSHNSGFDSSADSVDNCCRAHNIPEICVKTLCYPQQPPNDFDVYDIFEKRNNCSKHLSHISYCLAAGRDHSVCCENEAKDRDENVCFGMCRGEGRHKLHESWTRYQTCLAINVRSMFQCFLNGYKNVPTPPRRLLVNRIGTHNVHLSWQKPNINAHLVENYIIYAYQIDEETDVSDESNELFFETDEPQIVLASLESGTVYRVYAVAITNENRRSLKSDFIDFQTLGVAPQVEAFKANVSVSRNASSAMLACRFRINGISQPKLEIQWQHKGHDSMSDYKTLRNYRYNQSYFVYSASKPREHVTTLEINDLNVNDYGSYRCIVSDGFGKSFAEVQLRVKELRLPSAVPPTTPLACCKARTVEKRCLPMCGGMSHAETTSSKRYVPRPHMPSNCSSEISKVLSCAIPEVDDSVCCLREHVPRQCMYLCDSSVEPSNQMAAICLDHVNTIEQCRISGVEKRPEAIHGLKVEMLGPGIDALLPQTSLVSWEPSKDAEIYHIYWRQKPIELMENAETKNSNEWMQISQVQTSQKIRDADEIVVIAINSFGGSQASKLVFNPANAMWVPTF